MTSRRVSELANYRAAGFSVGKLMEFLTALDCDVRVHLISAQRHGQIVVHELEPA